MTKTEAISFFGSQRALSKALGCHEQSIQKWPDDVPPRWMTAIKNAMVMEASRLESRARELRNAAGVQ